MLGPTKEEAVLVVADVLGLDSTPSGPRKKGVTTSRSRKATSSHTLFIFTILAFVGLNARKKDATIGRRREAPSRGTLLLFTILASFVLVLLHARRDATIRRSTEAPSRCTCQGTMHKQRDNKYKYMSATKTNLSRSYNITHSPSHLRTLHSGTQLFLAWAAFIVSARL